MNKCFFGDCRNTMRDLIADGVKVQTCVTSPPYWGLRDYGVAGQFGLEPTIDEFLKNTVEVFGLVRELLHDDGTIWVNLGDTFLAQQGSGFNSNKTGLDEKNRNIKVIRPVPAKNLVGVPWRVAFALQQDGWFLRSDIIWHKPNPMPESVKDRPTRAHEYLFLLSKNPVYYYDNEAIKEPIKESSLKRINQPNFDNQEGGDKDYGPDSNRSQRKTIENFKKQDGHGRRHEGFNERYFGRKEFTKQAHAAGGSNIKGHSHDKKPNGDTFEYILNGLANKRDVWTVPTKGYPDAHFATYPPELIEPCILAGSRVGDIVFDPFFGSGTTGEVAQKLGRKWIGCELNEEYEELQNRRTSQQALIL